MSTQQQLALALDRLAAGLELHERRERELLEHERDQADYRRIGHRSEPRVLSLLDYNRATQGLLLAQFDREVPAEFWSLDSTAAIVACPCGEDAHAQAGIPHACDGEACGRAYLFTGRVVRVAFSPVGQASADPVA